MTLRSSRSSPARQTPYAACWNFFSTVGDNVQERTGSVRTRASQKHGTCLVGFRCRALEHLRLEGCKRDLDVAGVTHDRLREFGALKHCQIGPLARRRHQVRGVAKKRHAGDAALAMAARRRKERSCHERAVGVRDERPKSEIHAPNSKASPATTSGSRPLSRSTRASELATPVYH